MWVSHSEVLHQHFLDYFLKIAPLVMCRDWRHKLCRRGLVPPEECWAALEEDLRRLAVNSSPPPDRRAGPWALPPHGPLLVRPFFFPPWASRSPPTTPGWSGGTQRCLGEGAGTPSSHCEALPPRRGFPTRSWKNGGHDEWIKAKQRQKTLKTMIWNTFTQVLICF